MSSSLKLTGRRRVLRLLYKGPKSREAQRKQLRQTEDKFATAKDHIKVLKKKLEEAEKAKDQVEQDGYNVGVAEIEEALRAEVLEVCRSYCLQVWNEALNQAVVEVSFALRRVESVYYPPTIRASSSSISKVNTISEGVDIDKDSLAKAFLSSDSPSKEAKQPRVAEKETDTTKGVASDATKPSAAFDATKPLTTPKDLPKEKKASHKMEIVLATLPMPAKEDLKGKGPESSVATPVQSTKALAKDKLIIKMK